MKGGRQPGSGRPRINASEPALTIRLPAKERDWLARRAEEDELSQPKLATLLLIQAIRAALDKDNPV